jgi:hypothetical protein
MRSPAAASFIGRAGGCGDFVVWRFDESRRMSIEVRINEAKLPPDSTEVRLSIGESAPNELAVEVVQYGKAVARDDMVFCNDVQYWIRSKARWLGVSGAVVVRRDKNVAPAATHLNTPHKVSVEIRDVVLRLEGSGEESTVNAVDFEDVLVGWQAG